MLVNVHMFTGILSFYLMTENIIILSTSNSLLLCRKHVTVLVTMRLLLLWPFRSVCFTMKIENIFLSPSVQAQYVTPVLIILFASSESLQVLLSRGLAMKHKIRWSIILCTLAHSSNDLQEFTCWIKNMYLPK